MSSIDGRKKRYDRRLLRVVRQPKGAVFSFVKKNSKSTIFIFDSFRFGSIPINIYADGFCGLDTILYTNKLISDKFQAWNYCKPHAISDDTYKYFSKGFQRRSALFVSDSFVQYSLTN